MVNCMKYLLVGWIKIYQLIPGPWHNNCRFQPTCSFQGSILMIKRILRCNPWGGFGYDPVPQKGEKNEKGKISF